jgi:hypothetical protein
MTGLFISVSNHTIKTTIAGHGFPSVSTVCSFLWSDSFSSFVIGANVEIFL